MDFSVDELPAVKALGPLFKLTEVHLWDDGSSEIQGSPYNQETTNLTNGSKDYEKSDARNNGLGWSPEDVELAKKLNDLGLPLSFRTNKETRQGMTSGKRKGTRKKSQPSLIEFDDYMLDSIKANGKENISPPTLLDASKMSDQSEITMVDIDDLSNLSLELWESMSFTACTSTLSIERDCTGNIGFDHSLGCDSGFDNDISDEAKYTPCTNEMMITALCLDGETLEKSCLINDGADCDRKEKKGELDSVHLEALLEMDHDPEGQSDDISLEVIQDSDVALYAQFSEQANANMINTHQTANSGVWVAYWDDFYMRTYFYNVQTEESRWDPPSGMEQVAYDNIVDEPTNLVDGSVELDNDHMQFLQCDEIQASCDVHSHLYLDKESRNDNWSTDKVSSTTTSIRQKIVRRTKSTQKLSNSSEDLQGVLQEVPPSVNKYWCQRYLLFSRFDHGIKMDEEGWFSVTPELIAKHHAGRCGSGAIVDFFTGVGGNAIQFAQRSKHVTAIDIDPNKIDYARHNAAIYGVGDNIDFIKGDSFSLAPKLKANTVFMSPPWGGPAYSKVKKFDINTMLKPQAGQFLFNAGKRIAPKIIMFLPRNVDINQLAELSLSATPPWTLEVERNFLNSRLKAVTAYFFETP